LKHLNRVSPNNNRAEIMNLYPVTIVENFYENPNAIRKFALAQKYRFRHEEGDIGYVYPGCRTKDLYELDKSLQEKVLKKFISVFHISEHDRMQWAISSSFQIVSEQYKKGVIHTDTNTIFAGVLYLTPNAPLDSGTSLFRKNTTFSQEKYQQASDQNEARFKSGEIAMDNGFHSMFDEVVRINNVYNTLILFEGDTFHAANNFFGSTMQDSRLAQVFFVNRIDANKADSFPINRVKAIKI
jgi:hypothetical protein